MNTKLLGLILATILTVGFTFSDKKGKVVKEKEFKNFIDTLGLSFSMPEGYKPTLVTENRDLSYDFAIKDKKEDFEIRYTIWPLSPMMEEFNRCELDTNCTMVNPNVIYKGRIQANILNMTGGEMWEIGAFPKDAVKAEFNADAGGSSFFEFNCEFGEGYKYGLMVYLHKQDIADVVITYMSNNKETHSEIMLKSFYALKFK